MLGSVPVTKLVEMMVPISRFNKGEASKIFEEVKRTGVKFVLKNEKPACVLLTPELYDEMLEKLEDYELSFIAESRMSPERVGEGSTQEEIMSKYGISQSDLE